MSNAHAIPEKTLTPARPALADEAAGLLEHARERAGALTQRVKEGARQKEEQFEGYVREHPVKSVLVAAGIGAGVGLLIGALVARR